ncbi:MAG TPA: hypothetical protein VKI65_14620 [Gemmataceae bacterium]|nr:hypothetical protein [Gemmataceae bacterium]
MTDYEIQTNTRRCAATGRELRPGERVYTVLVERDGRFIRQDYSSEAWQGTPANAFGFWAGVVPAEGERRRLRVDDDLLIDCFERLEGESEPSRVNFRYVVALLLMRRRRLKFEEAATEGDQDVLYLRCPRTQSKHRVVNPRLTDDEMNAVQEEVFKILGWE